MQDTVQVGSADTEAGTVPERRLDPVGALDVADAGEGVPGGVQAEGGEVADGAGHQALTARLVDRRLARLGHDGVETGARRVQGGRKAGGPASDDQQVVACVHAGSAWVRAVFSQRTRTVSSAALASVNAVAVSHAEWTSGSAAISSTTAT